MSRAGESPNQAINPTGVRAADYGNVNYLENYLYGRGTERAIRDTGAAYPATRNSLPVLAAKPQRCLGAARETSSSFGTPTTSCRRRPRDIYRLRPLEPS